MNDKTNILISYSLLTKTTEIFQLCEMSLIMIIGNTWLVASRAVMLVTTRPVSRHTTLSIVPIFHMIYRFLDGPGLGRYTHVSHFTTVYTLELIWWGFLPHLLLFTLFWHTSLRGAGRLSNLLLLPFKLCRIAMWKVTPAHYKSFIVRFKYFNAKWVAWKGSIHFKDNTSQTIKQYHSSVAEIKFKSLINKMIKW